MKLLGGGYARALARGKRSRMREPVRAAGMRCGMLRQFVFERLTGYEDVNDAERLRHDAAMRVIVGGKAVHGARRRRAKWGASRRSGLRRGGTCRLSPIFPANGSTAFIRVVRQEALCSTWIRALVRRTANRR